MPRLLRKIFFSDSNPNHNGHESELTIIGKQSIAPYLALEFGNVAAYGSGYDVNIILGTKFAI
ncbi:hypothetical protein TUM4261_42330 [Shewanella sp. c952]|uniref:hypothetical protein n=1 Tax=Shewanella sp. c952 TaxID=2815913 RepID=UPI001BBAE84F|nr:hypothetical protein [Shewanella sp. c952]GIU19875.1 hypothetical protein TUM4261_42330 [Shewanella sp. c952]